MLRYGTVYVNLRYDSTIQFLLDPKFFRLDFCCILFSGFDQQKLNLRCPRSRVIFSSSFRSSLTPACGLTEFSAASRSQQFLSPILTNCPGAADWKCRCNLSKLRKKGQRSRFIISEYDGINWHGWRMLKKVEKQTGFSRILGEPDNFGYSTCSEQLLHLDLELDQAH